MPITSAWLTRKSIRMPAKQQFEPALKINPKFCNADDAPKLVAELG